MAARVRINLIPHLLLSVGLMAGCDQSGDELQSEAELLAEADAEVEQVAYDCLDGSELTAQYEPQTDSVVVYMDRRAVRLQQVVSGSGARFEADGITFWSKGNQAMLMRTGREDTECRRKTAQPE